MRRYQNTDAMPNNALVAKRLCLFTACSLLIAGLLLNSPAEIAKGILTYITSRDVLISDYFLLGSPGAAFFNGGLVMLMSIGLALWVKAPFNGGTIAMLYLMPGFALFGKNPVNILPFFFGVWAYCKLHHKPMSRHLNAALFSTTLAPVVSELMIRSPYPLPVRLVLAFLGGALIGYVIIPLAEHTFSVHKGYNLFNYGFAGGVLAMILASVFKGLGAEIGTIRIWQEGVDPRILAYLIVWLLVHWVAGHWLSGWNFKAYRRIMRHSGRSPTDFVMTDGIGMTMVNMAAVGVVCITYILLIGGDLCGPIVGAILTSVGFAAAGEHPRNIIPVMTGVYLASRVMVYSATHPSIQLAALFGAALAPISGQFGWYYGIIAGFLHTALVLETGGPCGGFNLYNNGFSAGLVALIMVSVIQGLSKRWRSND